jgi:hypothetical protein
VFHSRTSGARNVDKLFFILKVDRYGFPKKHVETRYTEHVFLHLVHLVGSAGHILHSRVSGARNIDTLFFMLELARWGLHKKRARTRYAKLVFLHPVGSTCHVVHFSASGARNVDAQFFMLRWDRYGFNKKHAGSRYTELCFCTQLDLSVTWCIPTRSGREMSTHYFSCSGGPGGVSIKSAPGHVASNMCFCFWRDLWVT